MKWNYLVLAEEGTFPQEDELIVSLTVGDIMDSWDGSTSGDYGSGEPLPRPLWDSLTSDQQAEILEAVTDGLCRPIGPLLDAIAEKVIDAV